MAKTHKIIIDGENSVMGRLASYSAKQAILGKTIIILNCNKVIIIGNKNDIVKRYKHKIQIGGSSLKGPKIIRTPERILKQAIRGMLSHKQVRGINSLKRIICYNKGPEEYKDVENVSIFKNEKYQKYITLKELVNRLK